MITATDNARMTSTINETLKKNEIGMAYAKLWRAKREIAEVQRENPTAICPLPELLVDIEARGLVWNFETGQEESIDA
jgi:hypothetical protein